MTFSFKYEHLAYSDFKRYFCLCGALSVSDYTLQKNIIAYGNESEAELKVCLS